MNRIVCLEIPCNALNFSNICIIYDLLITPASINSNNLDVYKIDKDWQITRLIFDFDVYKLVNKGEIIEEIGSSGTSRNDFGIIMQMKIITTPPPVRTILIYHLWALVVIL